MSDDEEKEKNPEHFKPSAMDLHRQKMYDTGKNPEHFKPSAMDLHRQKMYDTEKNPEQFKPSSMDLHRKKMYDTKKRLLPPFPQRGTGFSHTKRKINEKVDALDKAIKCCHTDIVKLLLDKGADPNKVDALHTAVEFGRTSIVKLLLDKGADPNKVDALDTAIKYCHTDIVKLLLDKGADPNKCNALEKALSRNDEKILDILLEKGADTKKVPGYVLRYAAMKGDIQTVKKQLEKGAVERMVDALGTAVTCGHTDIVRLLLDKGADPKEVDALGTAVTCGHTDIVRLLLDNGADPNEPGAFCKAVKNGHTDIVTLFLDKSADPNKFDALNTAVTRGHTDIVRLLLDKGADQIKDDALNTAVTYGRTDIVRLLLEKGADPNKFDALRAAVTRGRTDIVGLLLEKGADLNKDDALNTAVTCGRTDIVRLLLEKGADLNKDDALNTAVTCGRTDIVRLLLEKGADPNKCNALEKALSRNNEKILDILLEKGADTKKVPGYVLRYAAMKGDINTVKEQLEKGAVERMVNALDTAVRCGHTEIVRLLLDKGADPNKVDALDTAVRCGHTDILRLLLDKGADPNSVNALDTAVRCGHTDIVRLLLDKGADPNKRYALHRAIRRGHTDIVRLLLDKGADPDSFDVLRAAVTRGHTDIVRLLLEKGADQIKNDALNTAGTYDRTDIVRLLLEKGADPNEIDALEMAVKYDQTDIVRLLLDKGADPNKSEDIDDKPMQEKGIVSSTAVPPAKPMQEEDVASSTAVPPAKPMQEGDVASSTAVPPAKPMQKEDVASSTAVPPAKPMQEENVASSTAVPPAKPTQEKGIVSLTTMPPAKHMQEEDIVLSTALPPAKHMQKEGSVSQTVVPPAEPMQEKDIVSSTAVSPAKHMQKEGSVSSTAMSLQVAETDTEWIETVIKKQSIDDLKILEKTYTTDEINSFALPHFVAVYGSTEMIECMAEWKRIDWNEQCEIAGNKFGESLKGIGVSKATALYLATFLDRKDIVRSLIKLAQYENITQCLKNIDLSIEMEDVFMITLAEKVKDKHCKLKPAVIPGHHVDGGGKRSRVFIVYSTGVTKASDYDHDGIASVMMRNPYMFVKENGCNAEAEIRLSDADSKRAEKALSIHRENLWKRHSNLNIISASAVIHRGTNVIDKPCIVLYCSTKGVVPLGEPDFPKQLDIGEGNSIDVDVHEGYFIRGYNSLPSIVHHDTLKMGCNIGRLTPEYDAHGNLLQTIGGTLGPFVKFNNKIGFLTCAHVLFNVPPTSQPLYFQHTGQPKIEVVQPSSDATTFTGIACGHVDRAVFDPQLDPSVDAAVVELTDYNRIPRNGRFSNSTHSSYRDAGFQELPEFNSGSVQTDLTHFCGTHTVVKFGSTSDVTRGALAVCGVDVRLMTTTLGLPRSTGRVEMINQLQVSGAHPSMNFFQNGDSGSAVFMATPGTTELHLIGMAIGSTYTGTNPFPVAVVTPIGDILRALGPDISIASFP